jgi:hypothetical protein
MAQGDLHNSDTGAYLRPATIDEMIASYAAGHEGAIRVNGQTVYVVNGMEPEHEMVLVRSDMGDGGWSLHAPGSTDEQISEGHAPPLTCGPSDMNPTDDPDDLWDRPNRADYVDAMRALATRLAEVDE